MDEAASRIRMEVESKPEEIETLDRRILRLKIEREGLRRESDAASIDRLEHLEEELANLEQQSAELTQRWQAEKDKIAGEAKLKEQLDQARIELEQAQRAGDLARAGELSYGRIPQLEKQLAEAQSATEGAMLREEVTADDIAGVVSRWTGVPVERMMQGEREKLLRMEEVLGARVIGQEDAVRAVSTAHRPVIPPPRGAAHAILDRGAGELGIGLQPAARDPRARRGEAIGHARPVEHPHLHAHASCKVTPSGQQLGLIDPAILRRIGRARDVSGLPVRLAPGAFGQGEQAGEEHVIDLAVAADGFAPQLGLDSGDRPARLQRDGIRHRLGLGQDIGDQRGIGGQIARHEAEHLETIHPAWTPQVNGVVRTLQSVTAELRAMGHELCVIAPDLYASVPCPTYPEIRLALPAPGKVGRALGGFLPDAVHIATEGPLGLLARRWCLAQGLPFTTAYHTQFPEYVAARVRAISPEFVWRYVRWFHAPSAAILASTPSVAATLAAHDLPQSRHWGRGVDTALFRAEGPRDAFVSALPGPVQLYAGRREAHRIGRIKVHPS